MINEFKMLKYFLKEFAEDFEKKPKQMAIIFVKAIFISLPFVTLNYIITPDTNYIIVIVFILSGIVLYKLLQKKCRMNGVIR